MSNLEADPKESRKVGGRHRAESDYALGCIPHPLARIRAFRELLINLPMSGDESVPRTPSSLFPASLLVMVARPDVICRRELGAGSFRLSRLNFRRSACIFSKRT